MSPSLRRTVLAGLRASIAIRTLLDTSKVRLLLGRLSNFELRESLTREIRNDNAWLHSNQRHRNGASIVFADTGLVASFKMIGETVQEGGAVEDSAVENEIFKSFIPTDLIDPEQLNLKSFSIAKLISQSCMFRN